MKWMMLMPREVEIVTRPITGDSEHATLLRSIVAKLNKASGDLTLTSVELARVQAAAVNWRGGYERQFKALIEASLRHL